MNATKAVTTLLLVALVGGLVYWRKQKRAQTEQKNTAQVPLFGSTEQEIKDVADLLLVNVLDKDEFDDAHIPSRKMLRGAVAINVPFTETDRALDLLPKNTAIVIYGSNYSCSACYTVAERMVRAGFTTVKVFSGGMAEWYQLSQKEPEKYPVAGPALRPYLKMRVTKPIKQDSPITIITAEELTKLIDDSIVPYRTGFITDPRDVENWQKEREKQDGSK